MMTFKNKNIAKEYNEVMEHVKKHATLEVVKFITKDIKKRQKALTDTIMEFDMTLQKRVKELVREEIELITKCGYGIKSKR